MISPLRNREVRAVFFAQILGTSVAVLATVTVADWHTAGGVGYGGLIMAGSGLWLAFRLSRLRHDHGKGVGASIAGSRFIIVLALLATGYAIGLWVPAIALGILAAQAALYGSGLYLLTRKDVTRKDAEGGKL